MRAPSPLAAAVTVAALTLGGLAGLPTGDSLYTYMWRDAGFCDDCHVHDYANEAWARSEHGELTTCHDCHRVPLRHYPKNLYRALFDRPADPEDVPPPDVDPVVCEACHAASGAAAEVTGPLPDPLRARVVKVDESPLHRVHRFGCVECHGGLDDDVHRFTAGAERCEGCHEDRVPVDESGRALSCLDCHAAGFVGRSAPP